VHCYCIQEGKWQHVYIDTQIPCDAHSSNPLFARSGQRSELWLMLLEKVTVEQIIIRPHMCVHKLNVNSASSCKLVLNAVFVFK
jgi:Calpain family cysteine protease